MSVRNCQHTLRDIPEKRKPQIKLQFIISSNNAKKKKVTQFVKQNADRLSEYLKMRKSDKNTTPQAVSDMTFTTKSTPNVTRNEKSQ
jgi:hypothetical protein